MDTDQTQRLRKIMLSSFLSPTRGVKALEEDNDTTQPSALKEIPVTALLATGAQPTTRYPNSDPIVPIRRCTRPGKVLSSYYRTFTDHQFS